MTGCKFGTVIELYNMNLKNNKMKNLKPIVVKKTSYKVHEPIINGIGKKITVTIPTIYVSNHKINI